MRDLSFGDRFMCVRIKSDECECRFETVLNVAGLLFNNSVVIQIPTTFFDALIRLISFWKSDFKIPKMSLSNTVQSQKDDR